MRKIGILGGTFNPPHLGHLIMANEVCDALSLDEVRLMPTAIPPHKELEDTASPNQRLAMTELAVFGNSRLSTSNEEVNFGGISYTVDTIKRLRIQEPESEFYFVIGGDMVDSLHTWHKIDELITLVQFVGVGRVGAKMQTNYPVHVVESPLIDVSSTLLRKKYHDHHTTTYLVPEAVDRYIRQEGLYGTQ